MSLICSPQAYRYWLAWLLPIFSACTVVSGQLYDALDQEPPRVLESYPAHLSHDVALDSVLRIRFSEQIEPTSVGTHSVSVYSGDFVHVCRYRLLAVDQDGQWLEIRVFDELLPGVLYHLHVDQQHS